MEAGNVAGQGALAQDAAPVEKVDVAEQRRAAWRRLLDQFTSPMILVLLVAAGITLLLGDTKDTAVILAIVVFNGLVGFVQEHRAEQAMDALKRMSSPEARVVRGGVARLLPATEVVPGGNDSVAVVGV